MDARYSASRRDRPPPARSAGSKSGALPGAAPSRSWPRLTRPS